MEEYTIFGTVHKAEACSYCEIIMQSREYRKACDKKQNWICNDICSHCKIDPQPRYYVGYPR